MALIPVPWAIGHGADNSVEGARMSLHAATKGARGVYGPGDMAVRALPVPGAAVRVHRGGAVTPNDYPGAFNQSYAITEESSTDVPIPATGSSGGATRYLIVRIDDDQYAGNPPEDVVNGPYNRYAVVSSISGLQYPHVPLAKIVQPANTATITDAMITDIRKIANPEVWDDWIPRPVLNGDLRKYSHVLRKAKDGSSDNRGEEFPDRSRGGEFTVECPSWATRMLVSFTWTGVRYEGKNAFGGYYLQWTDGTNWYSGQDFPWDQLEAGFPYVTNWLLDEGIYIPRSARGKTLRFYPRAFRDPTSPNTAVSLTGRSGLNFRVRFVERADSSALS